MAACRVVRGPFERLGKTAQSRCSTVSLSYLVLPRTTPLSRKGTQSMEPHPRVPSCWGHAAARRSGRRDLCDSRLPQFDAPPRGPLAALCFLLFRLMNRFQGTLTCAPAQLRKKRGLLFTAHPLHLASYVRLSVYILSLFAQDPT